MSDFHSALEVMVKTKPATNTKERDNGEYKAYISSVEAKINDKGTHWLSIRCDMEDEQYAFVNFFFTTKSIEISWQKLEKMAKEFDIEINRQEFYEGKMDYLLSKFKFLEDEIVKLKVSGSIEKRNYEIRKFQ